MLGRRDAPFPFDAVRDLLGLVRAIRLARARAGAGAMVLKRIDQVGAELVAALDLATSSRPGTVGMRAAWAWAESGTRAAAGLVEQYDGALEIVTAARSRVRRAR